ncbi:MAG TPA: hypothetical protein ENK26_11915 [Gammaproteobacteria bacterium]|nr:hypothetical protein [Gammaproteobacteria bacterium]
MSQRAPLFLDPYKAAERGAAFSGEFALSVFHRLASVGDAREGVVNASFAFRRDPLLRHCVEGTVSAELALVCQRCLEPFRRRYEARFLLKLVGSEAEAEQADEGVDPVVAPDRRLDVVRMLEDELLLAIPDIPRHDEAGQCGWRGWREQPESGVAESPFAVLASLKKH